MCVAASRTLRVLRTRTTDDPESNEFGTLSTWGKASPEKRKDLLELNLTTSTFSVCGSHAIGVFASCSNGGGRALPADPKTACPDGVVGRWSQPASSSSKF